MGLDQYFYISKIKHSKQYDVPIKDISKEEENSFDCDIKEYFKRRKDINNIDRFDIRVKSFRKHADLQGWMSKLYFKKATNLKKSEGRNMDKWAKKLGFIQRTPPEENQMNGDDSVVVTLEDLIHLQEDMRQGKIKETKGFFFGESLDEDWIETHHFIEKMKVYLKNNPKHSLIYSGCW